MSEAIGLANVREDFRVVRFCLLAQDGHFDNLDVHPPTSVGLARRRGFATQDRPRHTVGIHSGWRQKTFVPSVSRGV